MGPIKDMVRDILVYTWSAGDERHGVLAPSGGHWVSEGRDSAPSDEDDECARVNTHDDELRLLNSVNLSMFPIMFYYLSCRALWFCKIGNFTHHSQPVSRVDERDSRRPNHPPLVMFFCWKQMASF